MFDARDVKTHDCATVCVIVYRVGWQAGELTMNPFTRSSFTPDPARHGMHGASRRRRSPQGNAMHMENSIVNAVTPGAIQCAAVPHDAGTGVKESRKFYSHILLSDADRIPGLT